VSSAGDLLSAETLLITIVGVAAATWYERLSSALDIKGPLVGANEDSLRRSRGLLRDALRRIALLMIPAGVVVAVFCPVFIGLTREGLSVLAADWTKGRLTYDPIDAVLWVGWLSMAGVLVWLLKAWRRLRGRLSEYGGALK
jgi:hypothetical protein